MSFTRLNYPAAFASEGNPFRNGKFPGEYNPYIHSVNDTMDIDDDAGVFSLDVGFMRYITDWLLTSGSTWRDSRSLQLPLLWNRQDGTTAGGNFVRSGLNVFSRA